MATEESIRPKETDQKIKDFNVQVMSQDTKVMNPVEYAQTKTLAKDLLASRSLPTSYTNQEQVMMAITAGRESGMSPTEAIRSYYFVNGSLNIYGSATPAALRRNGWRIQYLDETQDSCTAEITNVITGEVIKDTFTYREAELSGFTTANGKLKFGWKLGANRKRKLRYGVLSMIIHTYIPEVLGGAAGIGEYSEDYMSGSREPIQVNNQASDEKHQSDLEQISQADSIDELRGLFQKIDLTNKDTHKALMQRKEELENANS